tara:strand:- start:417 stop:551 length:135 start_codon:yes stop_codon:yes gene_type:complete
MIRKFIENIKEDPLNFIVEFSALVAIMIFGYGLLLFGAIISGNV